MTPAALKSFHPKLRNCGLCCTSFPDDPEIVFERAYQIPRPLTSASLASFASPRNFDDRVPVERIMPLPSSEVDRNSSPQSTDVSAGGISAEQARTPKLDLHISSQRMSNFFPPGMLESRSGSQLLIGNNLAVGSEFGTFTTGGSADGEDINGVSQSEENAVITPALSAVRATFVFTLYNTYHVSLFQTSSFMDLEGMDYPSESNLVSASGV
jgi:hypothetical protein